MSCRRLALALLLAAPLASCARSTAARDRAPAAEFLVVAGDSTYWISVGPQGARVRGSPLLLARGGPADFYELYTADDDRSFYDAVLVGRRVFRRSLSRGDSALIFADTLVPRLARRYAEAHPTEYPLTPDDDPSDDPELVASGEVDLLDVHGPYVNYEYRTEVQRGDDERYGARRGVLDWRDGHPALLADIFGADVAASLVREGRRRLALARDSIRRRADETGRLAQEALPDFRFDERSFSVNVGNDGAPEVAFWVPGGGDEVGGYALPLAPVAVPHAPTWWGNEVVRLLPQHVDSLTDRWTRGRYVVEARYDSLDGVSLVVRETGARRAWTVGRLPAPANELWALDGAVDAGARRALARAFDESVLYSEDARSVARRRPTRPLPQGGWRLAARHGATTRTWARLRPRARRR